MRLSHPLAVLPLAAVLTATTAAAQVQLPRDTGKPVQLSPDVLAALPPFDLNEFANRLEAQLAGHAVGYAFVVSYRDQERVTRAGGLARRAPDLPARPMSVDERFNIASASKTITAAGVMRRMQPRQAAAGRVRPWLDEPMRTHLPQDWTLGKNVDRVTFRQLLTHRTGITCDTYGSYQELRDCLAKDIPDAAFGSDPYRNTHFHVFRLILPRLNSDPGAVQLVNTSPEGLASAYRSYIRTQVLAPSGVSDAECRPLAELPALSYQEVAQPHAAGTAFHDTDLTCGASGWNLSAREMGRFIRTLLYTDRILPPAVVAQMRTQGLGLQTGVLKGSVWRTGHAGYFPGDRNPGQTSTMMAGLSNGVSVAVIVNSRITAPGNANVPLDQTLWTALASMIP